MAGTGDHVSYTSPAAFTWQGQLLDKPVGLHYHVYYKLTQAIQQFSNL